MSAYGTNIVGEAMRVYKNMLGRVIAIDHIHIMEHSRQNQPGGAFLSGKLTHKREQLFISSSGSRLVSEVEMLGDFSSYDPVTDTAYWAPKGAINTVEIGFTSLSQVGDTI